MYTAPRTELFYLVPFYIFVQNSYILSENKKVCTDLEQTLKTSVNIYISQKKQGKKNTKLERTTLRKKKQKTRFHIEQGERENQNMKSLKSQQRRRKNKTEA